MPRGKIHLQEILASLTVTCPRCGRVIQPAQIRRVNSEEMLCPQCGERFNASKPKRV